MQKTCFLLCAILLFGSLSGCLGSNPSSGNEESDKVGPPQSDGMAGNTDNNRERVNIHGLPWSTLIADCDDELKSNIWDARGLVELFNAIDYDDSGELSYCEIFVHTDKRLMPYDSDYAMHRWAGGESNSFTFDEYFDYERSRSPGMGYREASYREAFDNADTNQDQNIDQNEVALFITKTYEIYTGDIVDNDLFVESIIDSMRDGTLPLADVGDDGYLTFDEFAEFHYLGDEDYMRAVYFTFNEYSWIFDHTRGFSHQQLFEISDTDGDGFITSDDFVYLGNEFEDDMEFYWDFCEIDADSDGYMCWLSDWELDDDGERFSECVEVFSGAWYCDGGATDDEDDEEDEEDEDDEDDTLIGPNDWYHYPYGYCEWDGSDSRFQCKLSESDDEFHSEWYYCYLFGFEWHCTDYYGQLSEEDLNYDYYLWWDYMGQFEDEYQEDLILSIYDCVKGNDGLVNNSEFEELYYLMLVDSPSDVSFCLLDIDSNGGLSIDEIVNATNRFAGHMDLEPISASNYDSLLDKFVTFDENMDSTLDKDEFTLSNYWKTMGYRDSYSTFLCGDGYLIPASYLDDGEEDCPDGSDEITIASERDYEGDIARATLNQCTQEDITSCSGFGCGIPSFESLDTNGNGMLGMHEFIYGLYDVDDYYSTEMYENIFAYLTNAENDYETQEINSTAYELIGVNQNNEICISFGCGFPTFEEVDSNGNFIVDKDEFVNKMASIEPTNLDMYAETFDDISGDDDLVDRDEYEEFLHDYDDSYDNDEDDEEVDYSHVGLLFSKSRPSCWHIKFFDGTNNDYSTWGGAVRFTDSDGVVTTIEDFSSSYTFLTLTGSEAWLIEYMFTEGDVGFEIDGVSYGGDNGDDDNDFTRALYLTFSS